MYRRNLTVAKISSVHKDGYGLNDGINTLKWSWYDDSLVGLNGMTDEQINKLIDDLKFLLQI